MRNRTLSKAAHLAATLALALTLLAPTVSAADFYAIVDNFGKRARNAYMDVAADISAGLGSPIEVPFNVYDVNGTQLTEFTLMTNGNGFASSAWFGNFFDLAGGQPLLVRAQTPAAAGNSAATLYLTSQGAPMTIGLFPTKRPDGSPLGMGRVASAALGNFRSATLLIANVSGMDQSVDIFKGARGADGSGYITNPRLRNHGIWRVDLTQNEALSNVVVTSTGFVVVQVVIDDGNTVQSFMALPSQ
jgi:hypothetical protein